MSRSACDLSVVVPVYGGEPFVEELVRRVREAIPPGVADWELILVDDRSPDGAWAKVQSECRRDAHVKGIRLSRNFGQHSAITAGLEASRGRHVVVMDCDLQDDPADIPKLYARAREGFDVVYAKRMQRSHPFLKNLQSMAFSFFFNHLTGEERIRIRPDVGTFSLISRKVVGAFLRLKDRHRHYLLVLNWLGFASSFITVEHHARAQGRSSYSFRRLVVHALDAVTSQSERLLYASIYVGLTFFVVSFLAASALAVAYVFHGFKEGWASQIITVLFSTGIILMVLGVNGMYLAKTLDQARERPLFVVDETENLAESEEPLSPGSPGKAAFPPVRNTRRLRRGLG